jgi:hypothetical protein
MTFTVDNGPSREEIDARVKLGFNGVGIEYQDTASATEAEGRAVATKPGQPYEPVDGVGRGEFAVPTEAELQAIRLTEARAAVDHANIKGPEEKTLTLITKGQKVGFKPVTEGPFASPTPATPEKTAAVAAALDEVNKLF